MTASGLALNGGNSDSGQLLSTFMVDGKRCVGDTTGSVVDARKVPSCSEGLRP